MCWRDCAANFDTASALSDVDQFTPYCIRQRFHRAFAGGGRTRAVVLVQPLGPEFGQDGVPGVS